MGKLSRETPPPREGEPMGAVAAAATAEAAAEAVEATAAAMTVVVVAAAAVTVAVMGALKSIVQRSLQHIFFTTQL